MTSDELRARDQYQGNPLAKMFVQVLHEQIGIPPTTGSVLMALAHPGLLTMLELGHTEMVKRQLADLTNQVTIIKP